MIIYLREDGQFFLGSHTNIFECLTSNIKWFTVVPDEEYIRILTYD